MACELHSQTSWLHGYRDLDIPIYFTAIRVIMIFYKSTCNGEAAPVGLSWVSIDCGIGWRWLTALRDPDPSVRQSANLSIEGLVVKWCHIPQIGIGMLGTVSPKSNVFDSRLVRHGLPFPPFKRSSRSDFQIDPLVDKENQWLGDQPAFPHYSSGISSYILLHTISYNMNPFLCGKHTHTHFLTEILMSVC